MQQQERIPAGPHTVDISGVPVFRWMPRRFASLPEYQPENFGDSLAAALVRRLVSRRAPASRPLRPARLLSIGSVLHFADSGDVVWGTGINGKIEGRKVGARGLDVRAVRGPKTRDALLRLGVPVPAVFGDPGLLVPDVFPETRRWAQQKRHKLAVVPNFNDARPFAGHPDFVNPLAPLWDVVRRIIQSEFVVASSLHGIVIAEAFGVPVSPLASAAEAAFKYEDYALGTGRDALPTSEHLADALRAGPIEPLEWDSEPLLAAFPYDLWRDIRHTHGITATADADAADLRRSWLQVREILSSEDEVLIALDDASVEVMDAAMAIAQTDDRVRLRALGRTAERSESQLLHWARGRSATLRSVHDEVIGERFESHLSTHICAGRAATLARVIEHGFGPDEDHWRSMLNPLDAELRSYSTLAGIIVAPQKAHDAGLRLETGPLPLANWNASHFAIYDELVALATRTPRPAITAGGLAPALLGLAEAVETTSEAGPALHRAALSHLTALIEPGENYEPDDLDVLRRILVAVGPSVAAIPSHVVSIALGLPSDASLNQLLRGVESLEEVFGPAAPACAAGLVASVPAIARDLPADRIDQLRGFVRALLRLNDERHPASETTLRLSEALELSDTAFALASLDDTAIALDRVAINPVGFAIGGRAPNLLTGARLEVWSTDVTAGAAHVGALRCESAGEGDVECRGRIRHLFAPSGVLSLRAPDSLSMTKLVAPRGDPLGVRQQLLRPVDIPADGGTALLVRRPSAVTALRERLRHS